MLWLLSTDDKQHTNLDQLNSFKAEEDSRSSVTQSAATFSRLTITVSNILENKWRKGLVSKESVSSAASVGKWNTGIWIYQLITKGPLATVRKLKADVSSVSPLQSKSTLTKG